jgi:hypothetical protein
MLSPELIQEKQINPWEFIELWIDPIVFPPTILMLIKNKDNQFNICDIANNNKVIFSTSNYDEANSWLLEDEFERVDGRLLAEEII